MLMTITNLATKIRQSQCILSIKIHFFTYEYSVNRFKVKEWRDANHRFINQRETELAILITLHLRYINRVKNEH